MNLICFIPSKNRPYTKTYKLFDNTSIPCVHFLEPQDIDKYNVQNKVSILKNEQGISYVRNFMLDYAKNNENEWVIICDDDVNDIGFNLNGKQKKSNGIIFHDIYEKIKNNPFEIVGFPHRQHSWYTYNVKNKYTINRQLVEVCVMINVKKIKWEYRKEYNTKEDRDFLLQTIKYGHGVLRLNNYYYGCSNNIGDMGGLHDEYKNHTDEKIAKKLAYEWAPFIKLKRNNNRIDIRIDVKKLALYYNKIVK